jgi:cobalamin biosynthesis protein CbiG
MDGDTRYERPCKWLLATGAMINWIAAVLIVLNHQQDVLVSQHAGDLNDLARWLANMLG